MGKMIPISKISNICGVDIIEVDGVITGQMQGMTVAKINGVKIEKIIGVMESGGICCELD